MSGIADSNTETTVYVDLLDEGVFVMRPAAGCHLSENIYRLLPTDGYNPEVETWRFAPGSAVECVWERHSGEDLLVAKRLADAGERSSAVRGKAVA